MFLVRIFEGASLRLAPRPARFCQVLSNNFGVLINQYPKTIQFFATTLNLQNKSKNLQTVWYILKNIQSFKFQSLKFWSGTLEFANFVKISVESWKNLGKNLGKSLDRNLDKNLDKILAKNFGKNRGKITYKSLGKNLGTQIL